jgi:predicted lipoprotein
MADALHRSMTLMPAPNDRSEPHTGLGGRTSSPAGAASVRTGHDAPASSGMVRVIVRLRLEQYDELVRHVREVGSTMSAFCRDSAVKAMREEHPDTARAPLS